MTVGLLWCQKLAGVYLLTSVSPQTPDSVKLPTGIDACVNANADGVLVLTPTIETATVGHCIRWATRGSLEYKTAVLSLGGCYVCGHVAVCLCMDLAGIIC